MGEERKQQQSGRRTGRMDIDDIVRSNDFAFGMAVLALLITVASVWYVLGA